LLMFWYHVCEGFDDNIKFITENDDVITNIAYNYILSNDDQEVISFNNATLPLYYGLLRLAASYSNQFCKTLSMHANIAWAFEHLIPRANHYGQAVEELLQLIRLFSGLNYKTEEDIVVAIRFRRKAIELFCGCMDGGHTWTTFVNILKLLIDSEEDCIHVAACNGLNPLGEAFSTLFLMYHEATACNVTPDIMEVTNLLHTIVSCCHTHSETNAKAFNALQGWKDRSDVMVKALSLLNSFVPREIHKTCLDLLTIMLQIYTEDCIETCCPIIHQSHMAIRMKQNHGPIGPYFPKIGTQQKSNTRRNSRTNNCGELNMTLHPNIIDMIKAHDDDYLGNLGEYFEKYHLFVDKLCRYGLNLDPVPPIITDLSCMLAVEVLPLKFKMFTKLWQEVWNKSSSNPKYRKCVQSLLLTGSFIEFLDTVFLDERELLDEFNFYSFVSHFYPKVHGKVLQDQKQMVVMNIENGIQSQVEKLERLSSAEFEDLFAKLHGDMRALYLFLSVPSEDFNISEATDTAVELIINKCNALKMEEAQILLKQELQAKRRKEEKEQEKHKEELMMERKRLEELKTKAKNDQEEEKGATSQTSPKEGKTCKQQEGDQTKEGMKDQKEDIAREEECAVTKGNEEEEKKEKVEGERDEEMKNEGPTTSRKKDLETSSSSHTDEPPVKKKRYLSHHQKIMEPSSSEEIEMVPGPSYRSDETTTTTAAQHSDDSSISSDDFSSGESSSGMSSPDKSPAVAKNRQSSTAFRKTCDNLKMLLDRRRKKVVE